jgi:hypothetical protein
MAIAGYSGTPLVRKLGIKPGMTLGLYGAPPGFTRELVGLPEDVTIRTRRSGEVDLIVWFVKSARALDRGIEGVGEAMRAGLWVAWPKRASGVRTDVTEDVVRAAGLSHGLVDYKVCAINGIWSGLKFARRRAAPRGRL